MDIKKQTFVAGQVEPVPEWSRLTWHEKYELRDSALNPVRQRHYAGHISEATALKWARKNKLSGEISVEWTHFDLDEPSDGHWTVREARLTID